MFVSETGAAPGVNRSQSSAKSFLPTGHLFSFFLVTGLFFLWAVPNNLNDVLIRQFMTSFAITRLQAGLVQSAFYLGYFVLAIPAAMLMRRAGYKAGFLTGLALFGTGAILFWPAAIVDRYSFFLIALFVLAAGLSFLETAANPFIAQFGPPESSERRLNFSQAFNPLGSIAGVLLGTLFIFSGIELTAPQILHLQAIGQYHAYLHSETMRVVRPYVVLGILVWAWALIIAFTRFPVLAGEDEHGHHESTLPVPELLRHPNLLFAVIAQFLYVGAQVGTWSYFIPYVQQYAHQPEKTAGYLLTGTLAAFAVGRFVSAWLMRFVAPGRLMGLYSLANVALVAVGILAPGWIGLWSIFLTSFFMSVMYPTIFVFGIKDLGSNAKLGASLIVMAIVGGAALTPLMGWIGEVTGSGAIAYVVPLAAYIFVAWFSFRQSPGPLQIATPS
ncbi:MAG: L-fucose:H+ symporter permease [Acidobacteriaceae bacterium]